MESQWNWKKKVFLLQTEINLFFVSIKILRMCPCSAFSTKHDFLHKMAFSFKYSPVRELEKVEPRSLFWRPEIEKDGRLVPPSHYLLDTYTSEIIHQLQIWPSFH